ncbi:hypothetical protein EPUS_02148 [Endocarpon pusillum Z07020]|uniref:Uncharacterized protein n=1 Tax=Endocarpon pusillum (strain Z07020 / HMAS-L-300199) TaxID=1263415 RepID=U1GK80_ENDPU|nr:uncharacterized protein EPUS_02148 [Endocarpon pusillum Z07020]ERF72261.1 hypothetical protein EPUS_02148 [Endocarpon pusillum Z07020]
MASKPILLGLKDKKVKQTVAESANGPASSQLKETSNSALPRPKRKYTAPTPERAAQLQEAREEKRRKVAEAKSRQWIIVGLDFGVTFTGIAYIATNVGSRDVQVIRRWSGGGRQTDLLDKSPSRYAYASENKNLTEDAWGYQVQPGMKSYSWFKLLLDGDTNAAEYDDPLLRQSAGQGMTDLPPGKSAKDLAADYLEQIYKHTHSYLGEVIGKDKLSMVDEPEAAAVDAIKSTLEGFPKHNLFEAGQGIIIVDLGGGTVDLVSYKILKLEPLQLEELCVGIGAKAGSTCVDRALHKLMRDRYGKAFSSLPAMKIGPGSKFMEDFETIKRDFDDNDPTQTFQVHLKMRDLRKQDQNVVQYDFEEDEIMLTCADMRNLFQVAVEMTLQLILQQVNLIKKKKAGTIKTLIVCGGLGSSPYIKTKLDEFCEERFAGKMQVVRPVRAWASICRGAALSGLEASPILSRRSRYHYGFVIHKTFDDDEHDEEDAFDDPVYGKRAKNQMKWFVKKDEKLRPGAKKEHSCTYTIPPNVHSYTGHERFYLCMEESAPPRFGSDVQPGGEIIINVTSTVLNKERKRLKDEGFDVKKKPIPLDVTLSFKIGGEKGILEVAATSGKTKLGDAQMNYEANSECKGAWSEDIKAEA